MSKTISLLILFIFATTGSVTPQKKSVESDLRTLVETERAFSRAATEKGTRDAFLEFLAEDGIVFRPGPVNGKQVWRERAPVQSLLTWQPVYADVSDAGDLGYTTGPWEFRQKRTDQQAAAHGHFFTVWKKQQDGTWKAALDLGISHPAPAVSLAATDFSAIKFTPTKKKSRKIKVEDERSVLLNADREFAQSSVTRGTLKAFLSYLTKDARLMRPDNFPIIGLEKIRAALSPTAHPGILSWQPTFADVSRSGDLGYTYGTYERKENATSNTASESGNYVRIWRREADGTWKVALDLLNPVPPRA